jgi:Plasmid pRiA4b ORF-3-like protein
MTDASIARLKITLHDVKPKVLRRLEVPFAITLDRLHLTLQAALGWTNSHLFEFSVGDDRWGIPDPNWDESPRDARKITLKGVGSRALSYLYDFGDSWEHTVKIESLVEPESGDVYPRLIEVVGPCPPEDVGGPWGYAEFIEAIKDPDHESHAEMLEWAGGSFDPDVVDADGLKADVAALAQIWSKAALSKKARTVRYSSRG